MDYSSESSQRGAAHILLLVVGVLVLAAIGGIGYKVVSMHTTASNTSGNAPAYGTTSNTSHQSNTNSGAAAATTSTCEATYHDATLCKFAGSSTSLDKTAYTASLHITQSSTTSTMTLASDGKGNTKLTGSGSGATFNSITLNGTTYVQSSGSGPWIEYPSGTSAPTTDPTSSMNIGVGNAGITFKSLGTQACGSMTCYKYQVMDSATPSATQYVWFDNSQYKLREWQYTDGSNSTTMDITYGNVSITMPSPVESLSQMQQ